MDLCFKDDPSLKIEEGWNGVNKIFYMPLEKQLFEIKIFSLSFLIFLNKVLTIFGKICDTLDSQEFFKEFGYSQIDFDDKFCFFRERNILTFTKGFLW